MIRPERGPVHEQNTCINCGRKLLFSSKARLCPQCNSEELSLSEVFVETPESADYVFIECPGATIYENGTNRIVAGARFLDEKDATKGFRIVDHPVYAPAHTKKRRIRKDAFGKIRRCQACQDLTVRLRRREGPDFCIPSTKFPRRTKLKPVSYRTYD